MPETSVNEQGYLCSPEDKIGAAEHVRLTAPSCYPFNAQEAYRSHLGSHVVTGADARHDPRALCFSENVSHCYLELRIS
jgi:hypothetical protein